MKLIGVKRKRGRRLNCTPSRRREPSRAPCQLTLGQAQRHSRAETDTTRQISCPIRRGADEEFTGVVVDRFNDPSAGSPTETLLRLLLPLGGRV